MWLAPESKPCSIISCIWWSLVSSTRYSYALISWKTLMLSSPVISWIPFCTSWRFVPAGILKIKLLGFTIRHYGVFKSTLQKYKCENLKCQKYPFLQLLWDFSKTMIMIQQLHGAIYSNPQIPTEPICTGQELVFSLRYDRRQGNHREHLLSCEGNWKRGLLV